MDKITLTVKNRAITGRKVKSLRKENILPANIFGKNVKSKSVQVESSDFNDVFKKAGETGLVELVLNKKKVPVLIHNVQIDPVTDKPIHADFLQVNLKEKVVAQVPVELTGESPAEKQSLGTVVQYLDEIEVEALPTDLPDKFVIDLSGLLKVDDVVQVKDLKVDSKKIEVKEDKKGIILKVEPPREEEKVEEVVAEEQVEGEEGEKVEEQEKVEETPKETPVEEREQTK